MSNDNKIILGDGRTLISGARVIKSGNHALVFERFEDEDPHEIGSQERDERIETKEESEFLLVIEFQKIESAIALRDVLNEAIYRWRKEGGPQCG